mmetsp:Transcript_128057/g.362486  ORF Transcript_128057/g.362486 Transcript_128057/m.362486 type:complete len:332 (+) Transcript_128057:120-1115(+)
MVFEPLREALLSLCCSGRATGPSQHGHRGTRLLGIFGANEARKLYAEFGTERTPISIHYEAVGDDADEFDRAFEANDLTALVHLLPSRQEVKCHHEPKHPWAVDPSTIGTLAAMQLALLSSTVARTEPDVNIDICEAGAIPPLVAFLTSDQEDRMQAAVVALNYLINNCTPNARAAYGAGVMPLLITQLGSPVAGMRGAAASTLRHICTENADYCEEFINLRGMKGLVQQLDYFPTVIPVEDHTDLTGEMLEAVWNLEDIVTDPEGNLIERYARLAVEEGVVMRLQKLADVGDEDANAAAKKLLSAIQSTRLVNPSQARSSLAPCGSMEMP